MEYIYKLQEQHTALAVVIMLGFFFILLLIGFDLVRLSTLLFYKQGKPEVSMRQKKKKGAQGTASEISERPVKGKNRWKEIAGIFGLGFGAVAFYFLYIWLTNRRFPISPLGMLYLAGLAFLTITFLILSDFISRKFRATVLTTKGSWMLFISEIILLIIIMTVYLSN